MKLMIVMPEFESPAEVEARRKPCLAAASPGTEIEFAEMKGEAWATTLRPSGTLMMRMVFGPQVVEKAKEAEERGFDAVLPWGSPDLGVDSARCHVDIPVVGMGRSSFGLAASLCSRIVVICYHSTANHFHRSIIREMGFDHFVTSIRAVELFQAQMTAQRQVLKERLIELGKRAVAEEDAEIILPFGVSMVPVYCSAEEISSQVGIPVIDPVAVGVKTAEMLVSMGVGNSRKAYPRPL